MSEVQEMACDMDDWGEVINGEGTYKWIASILSIEGTTIIGWTDQQGTHLDILFSVPVTHRGTMQGGIQPGTDLFVSIMRTGAFAFACGDSYTHPRYFAEKLNMPDSTTTVVLAELINNVRNAMMERGI